MTDMTMRIIRIVALVAILTFMRAKKIWQRYTRKATAVRS